jgi:hypothetical protein
MVAEIEMENSSGTSLTSGDEGASFRVVDGSGDTPAATFTIRNAGLADLHVTAAFQGTGAAQFSVITPPASTVSGNGATTITVKFTPAGGVADADLRIATNDPSENPFIVKLHGQTVPAFAQILVYTVPEAHLVAPGTTFDLGAVDATGITRSFTIKNTGTIPLTLQDVSLMTFGGAPDFTAGALVAMVVPPSSSTTFPVTFVPAGPGIRGTTVHIASTNAGAYEFNLVGRMFTALETWRQSYFGSIENSGPGADLNDADLDGIPNIIEYATLSNPAESNAVPGALVINGGNLEYTITRPKAAAADLTYALEWTDSLTIGSWKTTGVTTGILSDDGVRQQVKFSVSGGSAGYRFIRLRVRRL